MGEYAEQWRNLHNFLEGAGSLFLRARELSATAGTLEDDVARLTAERDAVTEQIAKAQAELGRTSDRLRAVDVEVAAQRDAKLQALDAELAQARQAWAVRFEADRQEADRALESRRAAVGVVTDQLASLEADRTRLEGVLSDLQMAVSDLTEKRDAILALGASLVGGGRG